MQRFAYAPQLQVYIRAEEEGVVVDVSNDVISGSVTRRLNAMSTATLQLQNKYQKYTHRFNAMDRIIITASRIGDPFLIFSGYLDQAPYYQLIPEPITINASCTLKLLQFTYFDPGLPFMMQYFAQFGWTYNPNTGVIQDPQGQLGNFDAGNGIGKILLRVLMDIGGWDPTMVTIRPFPDAFFGKIKDYYTQDLQEEQAEVQEVINRYASLFSVTGSDSGGTVSPITPGLPTPDESSLPTQGNIPIINVVDLAYKAGFRGSDLVTIVSIAGAESGYKTDAQNNGDATGLWQILYSAHAGATINGVTISSIEVLFHPDLNAKIAFGLYSSRINSEGYDHRFDAWNPSRADWGDHTTEAQNAVSEYLLNLNKNPIDGTKPQPTTSSVPPITQGTTPSDASRLPPFYPLGGKLGQLIGTPGVGTHAFVSGAQWEDSMAIDLKTPVGTPVVAVENGTIGTQIGLLPNSGAPSQYIGIPNPPDSVVQATYGGRYGGLRVHLLVNGNDQYYYAHLSRLIVSPGQQVKAGTVIGYSGEANGVTHLHFAVNLPMSMAYADQVTQFAHRPLATAAEMGAAAQPIFGATSPSATSSAPSGDSSQPVTAAEAARIGMQSAYFVQQLTGGNTALSMMLTGKRALQNDIPLIEWVNQLVPAAGRVYCSGPDGRFYAFYPDYFGYFGRTPYFMLNDIEIKDFSLNTDDSDLTTHVYAVGPIQSVFEINTIDQAASLVASVEEPAFNYFINILPNDPFAPQSTFDPQAFLNRYGARPYVYNLPQVRHPVLLWMAAWMKFSELWANRFPASASFSFMPELFPGGRVSFGGRISMFINEVTHNFDRESGFSTDADLIAPAAEDPTFDGLTRAGNLLPTPGL